MPSFNSASSSVRPGLTDEPAARFISPLAVHDLPWILLFTAVVVAVPVAAAWTLRFLGATNLWQSALVALALSAVAGYAGDACWRRRGSGELPFAELLAWGRLSRRHNQRRLASTMKLLGLVSVEGLPGATALTVPERARLIRRLVLSMEAQDRYLEGHSRRVARHATMVACELGLSSEYVAKVRTAAAVHDVGKHAIARDILHKAGSLSPAELGLIRHHADNGAAIVAGLGDPELTAIVRHHHERYDGAGYPSGLVQEQIPLGARIIAVTDTFDALTSDRPYRSAAAVREALRIVVENSGSQFDPDTVSAFLRCYASKPGGRVFTFLLAVPLRRRSDRAGRGPAPPGDRVGSQPIARNLRIFLRARGHTMRRGFVARADTEREV